MADKERPFVSMICPNVTRVKFMKLKDPTEENQMGSVVAVPECRKAIMDLLKSRPIVISSCTSKWRRDAPAAPKSVAEDAPAQVSPSEVVKTYRREATKAADAKMQASSLDDQDPKHVKNSSVGQKRKKGSPLGSRTLKILKYDGSGVENSSVMSNCKPVVSQHGVLPDGGAKLQLVVPVVCEPKVEVKDEPLMEISLMCKVVTDSPILDQVLAGKRVRKTVKSTGSPLSVKADLKRKRQPSLLDTTLLSDISSERALSEAGPSDKVAVVARKLTPLETLAVDDRIRRRRRRSVLIPAYKRSEPQLLKGFFHDKVQADFDRLAKPMHIPEHRNLPLPGGRVSLKDLAFAVRNGTNVNDCMFRQVFSYCIVNQRKSSCFIAPICLLISNGFDCNVPDDSGSLPLKLAVWNGDLALVDLLLQHSSHLNLDKAQSTVLHIASMAWINDKAKWPMLQLVLEQTSRELLFTANSMGTQPIALLLSDPAFSTEHLDDVLRAHGSTSYHDGALLHVLALNGRVDLICYCVTHHGFDLATTDSSDQNVMHFLASCATLNEKGLERLGNLLEKYHLPVDLKNSIGRQPMDVAVENGNCLLVRWLYGRRFGMAVTDMTEDGCLDRDISDGREPFPISVTNDRTDGRLSDFVYIQQNILPDEGPPSASAMVCVCAPGTCNPLKCGCLRQSLAYSATGTIVPGACSGNPIYECGPRCGCGSSCQSRVVQRGIRMSFEIMMTRNRGWGVRADRTIQPGEFIMEFLGEIVESEEMLARCPDNDWAMELTVDTYDGLKYHVDPTRCGNQSRFLNHSCDPNLFPVRVAVSGEPVDVGIRIAMFSAQVIQKGKELTFDYGDEYWIRHNERGVFCLCGSSKCRFYKPKNKRSRD